MVQAQERRFARCSRGRWVEVLVTTDTRLRYQQNLATRRIAVVCLLSTSWPRINRNIDAVVSAIDSRAPAKLYRSAYSVKTANYALQRTVEYRGRPVLAMDGVLAGAEWALRTAAELGR